MYNNGLNEQKALCYAGKFKAAPPVLYVSYADVCFYKVTPVDWSIVAFVVQSLIAELSPPPCSHQEP